MTDDAATGGELNTAVETAVAERVGESGEWAVSADTADRVSVTLPDRELVVRRRDGPDGADHWTVELAADGATVSKSGPFETVAGVTERVRTLLDSDVRYTVCCDG
ncbi:hypothetical protein [Haloarcula laminariae]|uniref:hypothetical protein n=1 Tax=Haloarcula laminariae TaxID=2961577 RepID=UPI0021C70079|nr:hypothetical protein [Halomicroarcula laminariae]